VDLEASFLPLQQLASCHNSQFGADGPRSSSIRRRSGRLEKYRVGGTDDHEVVVAALC
jgi:hypothetical protein